MKRLILSLAVALCALVGFHASASSPHVIDLTSTQGLPSVEPGKILVIDFNADWCGPCRRFEPVFAKLAKEFRKKATFVSVNVDECPALARQFRVMSIPHVVILGENGLKLVRNGLMTEREFRDFINSALK